MNSVASWVTCTDWIDGVEPPQIPRNIDYPWLLVLAATGGERLCFSYKTYEQAKQEYDRSLKYNEANPKFLAALMAHRNMFNLYVNTQDSRRRS